MEMYREDCFQFTGYKPCKFGNKCKDCKHYEKPEVRIAVLSLEALGAVLRSTCLLQPILRKYPKAHITWITLPASTALLANNPYIHRLVTVSPENQSLLFHLEFDVLYAVDKSMACGAIAERIQAKEKKGFGLNKYGNIVPFNPEASYAYKMGLDDALKFHHNKQTETQILTEALGLEWKRDPYILELKPEEVKTVAERREEILAGKSVEGKRLRGIIGYNTGCAVIYPYKKFTVSRAIEVVSMWRESFSEYAVALLGGREDQERQEAIKAHFAGDPCVVNTPTSEGLRSGILWIATSDMVFSGCSLGMHISIALQKQVLAWFGVSCIQEIDLYDKGIKLQSEVACSPCWKKSCDQPIKCYDQVSPMRIHEASGVLLSGKRFPLNPSL